MPKPNDPRLMAPQCPQLVPVRVAHANSWFEVRDRGSYFTVEYRMTLVVVLPVVDNNSVVFVRVIRPVLNDTPWELPAGGTRKGEDPRAAARRELREETGIYVEDMGRLRLISPIAISSARFPVMPHVYQVNLTGEEYDRREAHDKEVACVERIDFPGLKRMIASGEIYVCQPISVVAGLLFRNELAME